MPTASRMQEVSEAAGRRPAQQFAGVDLRRPKGYTAAPPAAAEKEEEGDPCPRCESRDTKFCYYNNYNTAQPRHFCKGCRRYWTKGGTLRNVPVGGGTRKKPSSSTTSSSTSSSPSSYAAAAKPKRPYKKKRRVAPPPEPSAPTPAPDSAKTTTTTTNTDGASEITTELVVPAAAAEDDSLAHLLQPDDDAVALGLGLCDLPSTGKSAAALLEPDSFEWPPAFDLGACWATAGFGDPDPALFLNLP